MYAIVNTGDNSLLDDYMFEPECGLSCKRKKKAKAFDVKEKYRSGIVIYCDLGFSYLNG